MPDAEVGKGFPFRPGCAGLGPPSSPPERAGGPRTQETTPNASEASDLSPRFAGWLASDPETGAITRYPAEIFGPLPGPDEKGGVR